MEIFAQILGYLGMVLIVAAFFFKNIKTIRIVNLFGSAFCTIFATTMLIISKNVSGFLPTVLLNSSLVIVNTIMLIVGMRNTNSKK